jgi:selenocysteine lyase/cysteine desulfurase
MNLYQIRSDTAGCQSVIHLNNAGAALVPQSVANAIRDYITEEEYEGGYETADKRLAQLNSFYDLSAQLLNCSARNMAFTTSATDSYNRALSAITFKAGDVVLLSGNDYPSNFIAYLSLVKRYDIKMVCVENTATGEMDLDDLEQKLKKYAPRLVSVSHVPTSSGLVQPAEEIGEIISRYDSLYLLDACQSLGQMHVNAMATKADFISGTFRKFLRGPRGAGLLYVSDKALQSGMEQLFPDIRGASWETADSYTPVQDAKRFEDWETAYALMMGSAEAIKYLLATGIEEIETRNAGLLAQLKAGLMRSDHIRLQDRGKRQCNIVTFSVPGKEPAEIKKYFKDRGINIYTTARSSAIIDFAEKGVDWVVRVSPHYYNTEEEIDLFLEAVEHLKKI